MLTFFIICGECLWYHVSCRNRLKYRRTKRIALHSRNSNSKFTI